MPGEKFGDTLLLVELRSEQGAFRHVDPLVVLRRRTLQAALWVEGTFDALDLVGSLRSLTSRCEAFDLVSGDAGALVRAVVEARATVVGDTRAPACPAGRVMMFKPAESLSDGAAELESRGFFDAGNVPPCDTWIGLMQRDGDRWPVLLSWVPEALVDLVERAVQVNPEDCIRWLAASDPDLARALENI